MVVPVPRVAVTVAPVARMEAAVRPVPAPVTSLGFAPPVLAAVNESVTPPALQVVVPPTVRTVFKLSGAVVALFALSAAFRLGAAPPWNTDCPLYVVAVPIWLISARIEAYCA